MKTTKDKINDFPENLKYNRPDIVVCDSCKNKYNGQQCCSKCNIGNLFEIVGLSSEE